MVKLSHFEVQILQEGVAAVEHEDSTAEDETNLITKYVEVKDDQRFAITVSIDEDFDLGGYDALWIQITIDGRCAGDGIYSHSNLSKDLGKSKIFDHTTESVDGRRVIKYFRFKEAEQRQLLSNESLQDARVAFKDHGVICVEISRVDGYTYATEARSSKHRLLDKVPKDVVKESGAFIQASFDIEDDILEAQSKESRFHVTEEEPARVTFRLKYRTIETLRDQGIVNTIITKPGETMTISDDEDEMDLRTRLERSKHEIEMLKKQIKQETADEFREMLEKKRKVVTTSEAGELELTEE